MAEKQRKVGRPQSEYKTQFYQVDYEGVVKWQCRFCEMQYGPKTGTANLKRHLINRHPEYFHEPVLASPCREECDPMAARGHGSGISGSSEPTAYSSATDFQFHTPNMMADEGFDFMPFPSSDGQFPASNSCPNWSSPPPLAPEPQCGHPSDPYAASPQPHGAATVSNGHTYQQHPAPPLQNNHAKVISTRNETGGMLLGTSEVCHLQWPQHPTLKASDNAFQHATISNANSDNGRMLPAKSDTDHLQWPQQLGGIVSPLLPWLMMEAVDDNTICCAPGTMPDTGHRWPQPPARIEDTLSRPSPTLMTTKTADSNYKEILRKLGTTLGNGHLQWSRPSTSVENSPAIADPLSNVQVALSSSGRKRKQGRAIVVTEAEVAGLDVFTRSAIEALIHQGFSRSEIQEKMLTMAVCNPMYLHAFLNDTMHDFFTIVHPHFPDLSLSLINDDLLRRKREALKSLLKEFCDTRWSPLVFDVFVFPLDLGDQHAFAMVELVFLDKKGHRRSCLLDCVPLPEQFPAEMLCGIIAANLRAFEVDSKLSDCTMWGRKYEAANSVLKTKLECRRRGRADGCWEEEKKKQFFSVLRKTQEEQVYSLQIEVVQCLSCLDQLEDMLKNGFLVKPVSGTCPNYGVDMATIFSELESIFKPNTFQFVYCQDTLEWRLTPSSHMIERYLEIVTRKFRTLQRKMKKLSDLGGTVKRNLNQISCDRKYAVYYTHKNQKNINLLHIVPVTSYEEALKDIYYYLNNFMELLKNRDLDMSDVGDLVSNMDLIEIDDCPELSCNTDTLLEPKVIIENILKIFQDWRKIFQQGVALSREYISLCDYFTGYKNHESNIQSRYAEEFCDVARSAPAHLSPDKWKKVAFLRAWNKFQSSYE